MSNGPEKKLLAFADGYGMLPYGARVLAAVSGGADSVCLLLILAAVSKERGLVLSAGHFNHCLRGEESDGDEAFVKALCERLGVPFLAGRGDVRAEAEKTGESLEEAARRLRYAFLEEAAAGARIATAHTASDNAETVLLNLTRGAGTRGLAGIPPVRGDIIRPMLTLTRTEAEAYLREKGQTYREDSTNASDDYTRNLLRHRVLPVLREINPALDTLALGSSRLLRADDEYLTAEARRFLAENARDGRVEASKLAALPFAVSSRAVRELGGAGLSLAHVESVLALARGDDPSAETHIPRMKVYREYGDLVFSRREKDRPTFAPAVLEPGKTVVLETGTRVFCEKRPFSAKINKSFNSFIFKSENVCGTITIRPRLPGDRFTPEKGCGKTLKKLFIEKKIPAAVREAVPVVADERGILAVAGVGQTQRGEPGEGDEILWIGTEEGVQHD
ncbi:MAG: tRNA lysidine(34) synthetase TilS [Oscillospiraceae bacterium]|nr:tRNA lysidine(34) synthetase TilS [Oscillospiraceae bacterium]